VKIGLVSSAVPMARGGYRFIVDWLEAQLRERGHAVESIYIPSTEDPNTILQQMAAFRSMHLEDYYERVITFRPPAHVVQHPRKVVWFIHHIRILYDLWEHPYRGMPDTAPMRALREQVIAADTLALRGAHRVFSNSHVVSERLRRYNNISAEVLYPPVIAPERFRAGSYGDEIVCVCRMERHKRQHLLVEAMAHARTPVQLRLCGSSLASEYVAGLREAVRRHNVEDRVMIDDRWVTEDEKAAFLETALASAYVPFDEDSYGYGTIEAAHAHRCTVTCSDSGGVREFVEDGATGLVTPPDPAALGTAFDRLYGDRAFAKRLGDAAANQVEALGINWEAVVAKLLA
jgi:glycosyltransferase involved in cell wall biosynthesis